MVGGTDLHSVGIDESTATPAWRPNIVVVLTDDHAAHAIGCYGSIINRTPRIDEIAAAGWRLDNCFCANSLCSPSRASILTGTHSHVNGVYTLFTPIDASQPSFVSLLREAGYRTAIVGKWHLGHGPGHDPHPDHFDHWDVLPEQGDYWDPVFLRPDPARDGRVTRRTVPGYATDLITDLAIEWVESRPGDDPWCVLIHHKAPHRPWEPKPEHRERHAEPIPVPNTFWDDHSSRSSSIRRVAMSVADHLNAEDLKEDPPAGLDRRGLVLWKYQRYLQDYLGCIESIDENVGRVIDWLRDRGDFDDTLLLYASDQGFFLGDHGWFDKRLMFEESLRMPLVLSYPRRVPAGRTSDGLVTNVDVAQTILDAAGVDHHPRMQGESLWPDLIGARDRRPVDGVYYRYWENDDLIHKAPAHYGWRTERYKLIYYYNDGFGLPFTGPFTYPTEWELYDLEADPEELRNVHDDPAYAGIGDRLKAELWRAQSRLGDAPHPSQAVPPGCEDVPVAPQPDLPSHRWLDLPGRHNG